MRPSPPYKCLSGKNTPLTLTPVSGGSKIGPWILVTNLETEFCSGDLYCSCFLLEVRPFEAKSKSRRTVQQENVFSNSQTKGLIKTASIKIKFQKVAKKPHQFPVLYSRSIWPLVSFIFSCVWAWRKFSAKVVCSYHLSLFCVCVKIHAVFIIQIVFGLEHAASAFLA